MYNWVIQNLFAGFIGTRLYSHIQISLKSIRCQFKVIPGDANKNDDILSKSELVENY